MEKLKQQLSQRETEIETHKAALADAYSQGEAAGREAARLTFEDDRSEALSALRDALVLANDELRSALQSFEDLAITVAVESVDKLMGDATTYRSLLSGAITQQVRGIDAVTVVKLTVSGVDFPERDELATLASAADLPLQTIVSTDELDAGECRIQLSIGSIELDLNRHWSDIKAALQSVLNEGRQG